MFNRTHTAAIALAGAVSAAALTPAMAFTPPHNTINVGPPAHVNVPTPGPSPRVFITPKTTFGQMATKGGTNLDKIYTQPMRTWTAPPPPPPPPPPNDGTGWQ